MAEPDNIHARVCAILLAMAGREVLGVRNSELADAIEVSRPTISRDLAKLVECGMVEPLPTDQAKFRLGPKLIQVALAHQLGMELIQQKLEEVRQRYTRAPT